MRCQECRHEMFAATYIVQRISPGRPDLILNICADCLMSLVGPAARRKLDRGMYLKGWAQPELPLITPAPGREQRS